MVPGWALDQGVVSGLRNGTQSSLQLLALPV